LTGYCHEGFFVQVAIDLRIIAYFSDILLEPLKKLNKYCDRRNDYVHQFEGVSSLEDEENLVRYLYKIVRQIAQIPEPNSFTILNQQLHFLLTSSL
jgi:bacterioferritin (cytochrome b1)